MNAFTAAWKVASKKRHDNRKNKVDSGYIAPILIFAGILIIAVTFIAAAKDDTGLNIPLGLIGVLLLVGGAILRQMVLANKRTSLRSSSDAVRPTHPQPAPNHQHYGQQSHDPAENQKQPPQS